MARFRRGSRTPHLPVPGQFQFNEYHRRASSGLRRFAWRTPPLATHQPWFVSELKTPRLELPPWLAARASTSGRLARGAGENGQEVHADGGLAAPVTEGKSTTLAARLGSGPSRPAPASAQIPIG